MKRYETYKDSGIQWWEEIPTHWDLKKAKHMFSLVTENVSDSSLPKIALENIESWTGKYIETDSDFMGEGVEFKKDDILFGKLRPYLAKVYKAEFAGQAVGDIYVFRGNEEQNPEYLKYLLLSYPFISVVDGSTYGAKMPRANWDFISHLVLPCPPKTEQVTIAAFLDNKVGQIDTTIAEKEQMLEDLKAYRSAIVSEAVTKGLDKNVEMKDSGVEWIGMIPKHWVTKRLKFVSDNFDGTHYSPETKENGKPYVTAADIRGKGIDYASTKKISQKDYDRLVEQGCKIENNDVLLVKDGATTGRVGLMIDSEECVALSSVAMLRPKEGIYPLFLMYCMMSNAMQTQITNSMAGSAMPRITLTKLNEFVVCVPHLDEQRKIAAFVDGKIEKIDRTIDEINIQIDALKSYKTTLITEAVTGKIDLRDWKPKEEKV